MLFLLYYLFLCLISRKIADTSQTHSQDHLSIREDAIQPEMSSMTTRNSNRRRIFSRGANTKMQQLKEEDESSSEMKQFQANIKKQEIKKRQNRSMILGEDEIQPSSEEKDSVTEF